MERSGLGQILPHQAVGIFVGSTLARRIGFSEVGCEIEGVINLSMPGELRSIVEGQRADAGFERNEGLHNGIPDRLTGLAGHMGQQTEARLALDEANDGLPVTGADQRIPLPMADAALGLDAGRTL